MRLDGQTLAFARKLNASAAAQLQKVLPKNLNGPTTIQCIEFQASSEQAVGEGPRVLWLCCLARRR